MRITAVTRCFPQDWRPPQPAREPVQEQAPEHRHDVLGEGQGEMEGFLNTLLLKPEDDC